MVRPLRTSTPALDGALLAALAWLALGQLGLLRVAGLPDLRGVPVAAVAGALLGRWRPAALRAPAAAAVALLLVVAWTPLGPALLGTCVRRDLPPAPAAVDVPRDVDAVAVLSADVQSDGLVANRGVDRLLAGAAWSRVLRRPLVLSVIRLRAGDVSSEADQRRVAALAGIGAADLFFVDSVHVTRDEAVRAAALARVRGWRRVLVVTSPSHSRRACAAFERAGLRVTCAPAESRDYALAGPRPVAGAGERLRAFRDWLYEALGWWSYRARGWV